MKAKIQRQFARKRHQGNYHDAMNNIQKLYKFS